MLREHIWRRSLRHQLDAQGLKLHHIFTCRYVDNRLVLAEQPISAGPALKAFLHPGSYGASIEFEAVTGHSQHRRLL